MKYFGEFLCYGLIGLVIGLSISSRESLGEPNVARTAPLGMGVEHVFFRQKATVHTTRSRWIIGLVLDFTTYERYLLFTNKTLESAMGKAEKAILYFRELSVNGGRRNQVIARNKNYFSENWGAIENTLFKYYVILQQQIKEIKLLQRIHDRNWRDFQELRLVGHSELETNRMKTVESPEGDQALENAKSGKMRAPRVKRAVGSIIMGGIAGITSIFSIFTTFQLKNEVRQLRENQAVLRSVVKKSLLMVNLTRMEVQENRVKINQVAEALGELIQEFDHTVIPLRQFTITSSLMRTNLGKLRDLVMAESDLMRELFGKIDKLASRELSPAILPAPELVRILKGVHLELPTGLMLPLDPRDRPFFYYTALVTSTIALEDVLLIGIEVPLLDVTRKFKVMEAITLPVPYPGTDLTATYALEFHHLAISEDGRQYVILTLEDQLNCAKKDIRYCSLTSAIRETNRHSYCTLALYQRDEKKVKELCKIRVSNRVRLPTAHYVARGEWLVATGQPFNLRKHCGDGQDVSIVPVRPPYSVIVLESGCNALADVIELPIYFHQRREYHVMREDRIVKPPEDLKMTEMAIWKGVNPRRKELMDHLSQLGDIEEQPIDELLEKLETIKLNNDAGLMPDSSILYMLVGLIIGIVILGTIIFCGRKFLRKREQQRTLARNQAQREYTRELAEPMPLTTLTINNDPELINRLRKATKARAPLAPIQPKVKMVSE